LKRYLISADHNV